MPVTNKLFTELFRPDTLDGLVLPNRIRDVVSKGLIQNTLLYGPQGTAKTTIARILIKGKDVLKLNGSSENGIDVVRNQVVSFASALSLENGGEKMKVVFIDEADGLTDQAWDALRETIERYYNSVRFICTCNKIDKIPGPIRSRFNCIAVYPLNKPEEAVVFQGYCDYVGKILTGLKISYTDESLKRFISSSFPDMRTILNGIQSMYTRDVTSLEDGEMAKSFDCSDLFELIVNGVDPQENYKYLTANYSTNPDQAMHEISDSFVNFLFMNYPQYAKKVPYIIVAIAEYMFQLTTAPDRLLVLMACCFKLQIIIKDSTF